MAVLIGVLVGLAVCIPPGPVNIVVISQAMKRGFLHGFAAGLLAAVLDVSRLAILFPKAPQPPPRRRFIIDLSELKLIMKRAVRRRI